MKYKKRPAIIEALQWDGKSHRSMAEFLGCDRDKPIPVEGKNFYIYHSKCEGGLIIKTLEGEQIAAIGDFIVKGIDGKYFPCKPNIFADTYEKVEG